MEAIHIILYAVVVTLVLTIAFPRIRQAEPAARPRLWALLVAGIVALLVVAVLVFNT
jgi:hypothetical protein